MKPRESSWRAALTARLQSFERELLTEEANLAGLAAFNRELVARAEGPLDSKPGSNFTFAKRRVSVLIRFRIENESCG